MKSDVTTVVPTTHAEQTEKMKHSTAFKRKRKMLLMLPLICLPFISLGFWALGGGKKTNDKETTTTGLLLNLPNSKLKEADPTDKLRFYEQAEKDSLQLEEWMRTDPYYRNNHRDSNAASTNELQELSQETAAKYNVQLNSSPYSSRSTNTEDELMRKLEMLQRQLETNPTNEVKSSLINEGKKDDLLSTDVDRLQLIMQQMQHDNQSDEGIKAIESTLDKVLDIQHPERVKERIKQQSNLQSNTVFPVSTTKNTVVTSLLDSTVSKQQFQVGFFGIDESSKPEEVVSTIEAVVHSTQTLVNGSIIQMRVATEFFINGILIPKGTKLNGKVSLNDERLEITISSLRYGKQIFPVELEVYDMDGMTGIYIPGAISRDVAKESAQGSLQQLDLITLDPSFKAQAATAGVNTLKQLIGRKVKEVKVVVKEGHKLLLRDKKRKQQ